MKSPRNRRKKNIQFIRKMGSWPTPICRFVCLDLETQDAIIAVALMHGANWEADSSPGPRPGKWTQIIDAIEWYTGWEQFMQNVNRDAHKLRPELRKETP